MLTNTFVIAPTGLEEVFEEEMQLKKISYKHLGESNYYLPEVDPTHQLIWCSQIWHHAKEISFTSIGDAVKKLKLEFPKLLTNSKKKNYYFHPTHSIRRMMLIAENFPTAKKEPPLIFGHFHDDDVRDCFIYVTLLDPNTLLVSTQASPHTPGGIFQFQEDKVYPPSRAYLKLWEFFSRFKVSLNAQDVAIDLGSSPGGWTWVLAKYAKEVISVDKAPLSSSIYGDKALSKITSLSQSAYGLNPEDFLQVKWIFCDIIAYPEKTIEMILKWVRALQAKGMAPCFVCTLKFQGKTNFKAIQMAQSFTGSHIVHLHHNKHELTWFFMQIPC